MSFNVGDLVQECLPLMAGDAQERVGVVIKLHETNYDGESVWCHVLFDQEELMHFNSLKKVEG